MCILCLKHISIWTRHISRTSQPHMTGNYYIGQFQFPWLFCKLRSLLNSRKIMISQISWTFLLDSSGMSKFKTLNDYVQSVCQWSYLPVLHNLPLVLTSIFMPFYPPLHFYLLCYIFFFSVLCQVPLHVLLRCLGENLPLIVQPNTSTNTMYKKSIPTINISCYH